MSEWVTTLNRAAGPRQYFWLATLSAGIFPAYHTVVWLHQNDWRAAIMDVHAWIAAISLALLVPAVTVGIWVFQYAEKLRKQIEGGKNKLAKLRTEGVNIRHVGCCFESEPTLEGFIAIQDTTSLNLWIERAHKWNNEVVAALREINEAAGEWFSVLDVWKCDGVPEGTRLLTNPADHVRHKTELHNHMERVKRLSDLIREGLLNEPR